MQKGARSSQKGTEKAQNYVSDRRIYKHRKEISRCESQSPRHQYFNFLLLIGKSKTPTLLEYICLPALLDSFFFSFFGILYTNSVDLEPMALSSIPLLLEDTHWAAILEIIK